MTAVLENALENAFAEFTSASFGKLILVNDEHEEKQPSKGELIAFIVVSSGKFISVNPVLLNAFVKQYSPLIVLSFGKLAEVKLD